MFFRERKKDFILLVILFLLSIWLYMHANTEIEKIFCAGGAGFWLFGLTINIDRYNTIIKTAYELLMISESYIYHEAIYNLPFIRESKQIVLLDALIVGYKKNDNPPVEMDALIVASTNYLHTFKHGVMMIPTTGAWEKIQSKIKKDADYLNEHPVTIKGNLSYIPIKDTDDGEFWITEAEIVFQ